MGTFVFLFFLDGKRRSVYDLLSVVSHFLYNEY